MDDLPSGIRPCLSCTRSCYNEHGPLPDKSFFRPPCFVRALCDSNLAAMATCWMVIPSAWLKLYGDEVGNSAILHGPSGNVWQVGVGRPKWVAFRVGWRTFAADNCLEKGDMLVFTLIGNSEFSVKIFDNRTCLEKESSLIATNTGCYDSRSPVLLGEKRKHKDDDENPPEIKKICVYENKGIHIGNNVRTTKSFHNRKGFQQNRTQLSAFSPATRISQRESTLVDPNSQPLFIPQNPTSGSGRRFPVQHQLVDTVGARAPQEYASGIVYQPHPISIRSHNVGAECGAQAQFTVQEGGSGGLGPATRFASQRRPVMDSARERSSDFLYRRNSCSTLITPDHSSHTLHLPRESPAQTMSPKILSPAVIMEREKALELARRAQDMIERPSHLVVLRAFHVHGRAFVRFPVTFGKQHMPRKTAPMHLLDSNGHRWPMTWLRDNETHMGLTRGWRDFCLAEGLSEGDICIFELIDFIKLTLLIHVYRSSDWKGSSQVVVTKSKRLNTSHVRYPVHKKSFIKKNLGSEEGRGPTDVSLGGKVENQHSFTPAKMVKYHAFHRTTLPDPVRSRKECFKREDATAGSVGKERLKRLSFWSLKEQDLTFSSQRKFNHESGSLEGLHMDMCINDDSEFKGGDMSKAQASTYGEILCEMSSRCEISNTCSNAWNIESTRNNSKIPTLEKHKLEGQQSQVEEYMKENDFANGNWRLKQKKAVKLGCSALRQWIQNRKRYSKYDDADQKSSLGWARTASNFYALRRKLQGSSRCSQMYLASRRLPVTKAQREAAKEAALAVDTVNPAALVIMKKSNVYKTHTVDLPPSFSRQLSSDEGINIFLRDAAGQNTKVLLIEKALTRGWRQFSLDHLLEEGDVCVFELVDVSQLIVFVHIFRVVDLDHKSGNYRHHYRIIWPGIEKWRARSIWRIQSDGQVVKASVTRTYQPRRNRVSKSLYLAIKKTRAKRRETQSWLCGTEPLALDLNLDLCNIRSSLSNAPSDSSTKTTSTGCSPTCKLFREVLTVPLRSKETTCMHQPSPISGTYSKNPWISPMNQRRKDISPMIKEYVPKDICKISNESSQKIVPRENDNMLMTLRAHEHESDPDEDNYYRVVRILKKRYFQNEKQYLTELDGPVVQRDRYGRLREYDDRKWWVPEMFFSSGFASCYLR